MASFLLVEERVEAMAYSKNNNIGIIMENIEKSKYEGYLWYSDKTEPKVYWGDKVVPIDLDPERNPFIVEGQLWDGKTSIGIKFVDGKYYVARYPINKIDDVETYVAHRMKGVAGLKFVRIWKEQPDDFCNGYYVKEPVGLAFVGFKKKEEE